LWRQPQRHAASKRTRVNAVTLMETPSVLMARKPVRLLVECDSSPRQMQISVSIGVAFEYRWRYDW